MPEPGVSRRQLLLAAGGLVAGLAGCSEAPESPAAPSPEPTPPPPPEPDEVVTARVVVGVRSLLEAYDAAALAAPALAASLAPFAENSRAHLAALGAPAATPGAPAATPGAPAATPGADGSVPTPAAAGSAPPPGTAAARTPPAAAPADPAAVVAGLVAAEEEQALARRADVLEVSPGLARLLASIGAAEAAHAALLRRPA